jgi:hypothetical protein
MTLYHSLRRTHDTLGLIFLVECPAFPTWWDFAAKAAGKRGCFSVPSVARNRKTPLHKVTLVAKFSAVMFVR